MSKWLLLVTILLGTSGTSRAADVVLTSDAPSFHEHFSPATRVGGRFLAGLWLGEPPEHVALDTVRLLLPLRPQRTKVCMTANTRDGEYWMEGRYDVPVGDAAVGDPKISTQYRPELSGYPGLDLGVRAEMRADCEQANLGPFVPAIGGGPDGSLLVALINSQRAVRVRAQLSAQTGGIAIKGDCQPLKGGRSTAFDTACRMTLPAPSDAGSYVLEIRLRNLAGDEDRDSFLVDVARRAP